MPRKTKNKKKGSKGSPQKTSNSKSNKVGTVGLSRTMVASAISYHPGRVGMSDVRNHVASWLVGYTYVGNGTLGAIDSVYFVDPTVTDTITLGAHGANVPIAPADAIVGATYIGDVIKHYARMKITNVSLRFVPLYPNTQNGMSVIVAPQRGAGNIGTVTTDTTAATAYTNVLSMSGQQQFASWEACDLNMTSCIAGGAGGAQNEFEIATADGVTNIFGQSYYISAGIVPCTFVVSGNNSTSGLRGTKVHAAIATMKFDLIDFVGGNVPPDPEGLRVSILKRGALSSSQDKGKLSAFPRVDNVDSKEGKEKKDEKKIDKELIKYCGLSAGAVEKFLGDDCKSDKLKCQSKGSLDEVNSTASAFATKQASGSSGSLCDSQPMDLSESTLLKKGYVRLSQK